MSVKLRELRVAAPTKRVLREHIRAVCLSICCIMGMVTASAEQGGGSRSGKLLFFDIAPQPLDQALDDYARITGMAGLIDQELVAGRHSSGVRGLLASDQALRILLAGTELSVRYASGGAFTLEPSTATTIVEPGGSASGKSVRADLQGYFAELQEALAQVLCRRPETEPGRYRLGLQLWIGPSGMIQASHLLSSTGDDRRDAVITDLLGSARVTAPPPSLSQPVTLVLMTQPGEQSRDCRQARQHAE